MLISMNSNCAIHRACISCTMQCGKLLLAITLISNENKYHPSVEFNRLTQFSTLCLMELEQSNYAVLPKVRMST